MTEIKGAQSVVDPLRDLTGQLERSGEPRSKLLRVSLAGVATKQEVPHGLGQAFKGAACIGVTPSNLVCVLAPSESSDSTKRIAIVLTTATPTQAILLVYY